MALLAWLAVTGAGPGPGGPTPGDTTDAVVVRRPVAAGAPIGTADLAVAHVPTRLVPEGGHRAVADVAGRTATTDLVVGEIVVDRRLAPEGVQGVAATLPAGRRAVPVPLSGPVPGLAVGHHVDLLAPSAASATPSARAVARDAVVLSVDGEVALVSVADDEAAAVAAASATGALVPAIVGATR